MITVKIHTEKESFLLQKLKSLVDLSLSAMQVYRPPALMFTFRMAICSREEKWKLNRQMHLKAIQLCVEEGEREGGRARVQLVGVVEHTYMYTHDHLSVKKQCMKIIQLVGVVEHTYTHDHLSVKKQCMAIIHVPGHKTPAQQNLHIFHFLE